MTKVSNEQIQHSSSGCQNNFGNARKHICCWIRTGLQENGGKNQSGNRINSLNHLKNWRGSQTKREINGDLMVCWA